ncbi:hypothetical protein HNR60_000900 [Rhodopseudomonas rhenobacensis]|uniref:Uncharacterized protein n=1 Tax=Rhodopseudomonas rhenobacensis TaxID=87461 RepID=A0A7W8DXR2_9BRAD|nr:hypothetical protein [Rhodopseudomonas rhenobacensis]MBB5046158.1 hypothetical protein [Rhodopseudomonas rhenobacensis]
MKTFWMEAELGNANIKTLVQSDKLDGLIAWWEEALTKQSEPDHRQASRNVVVEALKKNLHHTDEKVAEMVCGALLWLTATGPIGTTIMPFMRRGDMTIRYEITQITETGYNFCTKFDEKTDAALML